MQDATYHLATEPSSVAHNPAALLRSGLCCIAEMVAAPDWAAVLMQVRYGAPLRNEINR